MVKKPSHYSSMKKTEIVQATAQQGADITFTKSKITKTATFIAYSDGGVNMELMAAKMIPKFTIFAIKYF